MSSDVDPRLVAQFAGLLNRGSRTRVGSKALWHALSRVFPHRVSGPPERELLLDVLRAAQARGAIRLPPATGRRWDRSMVPAVPTSVDLVQDGEEPHASDWRRFPWHPELAWVADLRAPSELQIAFLQRVHEGLVRGALSEPAPIKYRSLQLTGDEKRLAALANTSLFGPGRLTLDMLGCFPDALPLAWEAVGDGNQGRVVIFENAGPFAVARRVLAGMEKDPPYDMVAYGGGRSLVAALGHLLTIGREIRVIDYVGDIDLPGLEIALAATVRAAELGLPRVRAAANLHRAMFRAAADFGHPDGWPSDDVSKASNDGLVVFISKDFQGQASRLLKLGNRIPEEVLGPTEMRRALA